MELPVASFAGLPTKNPIGGHLGVDEIQLHRTQPRDYQVVDCIQNSFQVVKDNPVETIVAQLIWFFVYFLFSIIIQIISTIVFMVIAFAGQALAEASELLAQIITISGMGVVYIITFTLSIVINSALIGGYYIILIRAVRGQNPSLEQIMHVKPFIKGIVITSLLLTVAMMFGALLLIIPAYIIMLGCWFSQLIVIDKNLSGMDALKASWRLSDGHKLNLLGYFILTGFLNFAGMLACGVGVLVTFPMTFIGAIMIYDALAEPGNAYAPEANAAEVFV